MTDLRADPIPMRLPCPACGALHLDEGEFATKPHHTHACQECGNVWRPALIETVGVRFLPGFKNDEAEQSNHLLGRHRDNRSPSCAYCREDESDGR